MRPKIVIILLLVGLAGLAVILFLKPPGNHPPAAEALIATPATPSPETKTASVEVHPVATTPALPTTPATATPVKSVTPRPPIPFTTPPATGPDAVYVQAQIDRLVDLQSNNDDASLQAILKELTNPNKEVRLEAIEATIQFGGHTAVPVLQDLATRTTDPAEKQELLDAAEFLALPTLSEAKEQKKLERAQGTGVPK